MLLGSVGHRVKIHNITTATGKERGDLEIKDYVVPTNTRRSDGAPDPDTSLREVTRIKMRHYRNLYLNHPNPITFIPLTVDTTGQMYDEFICFVFR